MKDCAQVMFDDLRSRGWECISDWVANREPESLHFDFKQKGDQAKHKLEDGDRTNIAKAISGFANGEGGVLVVGLGRINGKDRDDPDMVGSVKAIANVGRFVECLDREAPSLTDPPISGLDVAAVEDPRQAGSGIAAILVPASDAPPHRVLKGSNDYYIRIGTRTLPMTHQMLAEKFGRRPVPSLRLRLKLDGEGANCCLRLSLRNEGRGVARQPAIHFTNLNASLDWFQHGNLSSGWSAPKLFGHHRGIVYQSDSQVLVYPRSDLVVGVVRKTAHQEPPTALEVRGTVYCVDAQPFDFESLVFPGKEVILLPDP
jgi:hypothetical protein